MGGFNAAWWIAVGIGVFLAGADFVLSPEQRARFGHALMACGLLIAMSGIAGLIVGVRPMPSSPGQKTTQKETHPDTSPSPDTTDTRPHGSATITMPRDGWMEWWGSLPGGVIRVIARVEPFIPYRLHLHLMLICSIQDNTVDEMEDARIEKSSMFSVTEETRLVMEMPVSQEFLKRAYPDKTVHVSLVLLPNPLTSDQISKRSDVGRLGGTLLVTNGFVMHIKRRVTPVPSKHHASAAESVSSSRDEHQLPAAAASQTSETPVAS